MIARFARRAGTALVAATALGLVSAAAASAAPAPAVTRAVHADASGIAGYYANDNGGPSIRDAKAVFTITPEMEQLTQGTLDGAVGAELCNPNTSTALQAGVAYVTGTGFEFKWGFGSVSGPADSCVTGGLASITHEFGGNVNHLAGTAPVTGDQVSVEVYYNPVTHQDTLTACDITNDTCSQAHLPALAENWREAGIGVLDRNSAGLVPPAILNVTTFSFARFTAYGAKAGGKCITGSQFDTQAVTALNSLSNAVLVPGAISGCDSFAVSAGIS